jgi:hypothetical protein
MLVRTLATGVAVAVGLLTFEIAVPEFSSASAQQKRIKLNNHQSPKVMTQGVRQAKQQQYKQKQFEARRNPNIPNREKIVNPTIRRGKPGLNPNAQRDLAKINRIGVQNRLKQQQFELRLKQKQNAGTGPVGSPQNPATTVKFGPGRGDPVPVRTPGKPPVTLITGPGTTIPRPARGPRPGAPVVNINNRIFPVVSGPKRIWWSGGWKTFVPYAALGAVTVGGAAYYANSYVSAARPYCSGITPQGCQLRWQMVSFEGGGGDYQCVQFCPQGGPPPAAMPATAMMPPPGGQRPLGAGPGMAPAQQAASAAPPQADGKCELTIFAEPGFAGLKAPVEEDQPQLGEAGWKNQIASIQVTSGTWDFFTEDEFQGESMRLPPGQYPQLAPEWSKRVGSFMCLQGS